MWGRCPDTMLKAKKKKNGKELMCLPNGTLLKEDYSIIYSPNQDIYECEGLLLTNMSGKPV